MADEIEELEVETETGEAAKEAATETIAAQDDEAAEGEELVVLIGDDEPEDDDDLIDVDGEKKPAPSWVKDLRRQNREKDRRIKELEAAQAAPKVEEVDDLPARPVLADFDFDDDAFADAVIQWTEKKRKHDERKAKAEEAQRQQQEEWQATLQTYEAKKRELGVRDYAEAEAVILDTFDITQQGIMIQAADNPALLAYAIGKSPKRAAELAKITNPIKFAKALFELEKQVKTTKRGGPPPPEGTINRRTGGAVDNTIEKLRAEAEKTGDYSKVLAWKRKQRA